jgi:dTDP-4-amino-4,6-dideoxygalactose transaminase
LTGGGGMVLCKDDDDGIHTKHITTTAKVPHPYEFFHDEPGFNYRLPNLNAALGCAQMEVLPKFLTQKRELAIQYKDLFKDSDFKFVEEPVYAQSNYWLNAIICPDAISRDIFIKETKDKENDEVYKKYNNECESYFKNKVVYEIENEIDREYYKS